LKLSELDNIWNRVRSELRAEVSDSTFQVWLDPLRPRLIEDGVMVIEAPDSIRVWVEEKFSSLITQTTERIRGSQTRIEISKPGSEPSSRSRDIAAVEIGPTSQVGVTDRQASLNPKLTFDQFVIGEHNRLAHAAALSVAELPSQAYNPLFIYGPPGVGKTHLLHAIGNLASQTGETTVRYATAEQFTSSFVGSLRDGSIENFKRSFRENDILLLDDAQFLRSKSKTEEEFFHTFNSLIDAGAQVVIGCDRMPSDLDALERRLRDRFSSGLVVDIEKPDLPSRSSILAMRARRDGLGDIPGDAIEAIAERITDNVRMLEGALIRVSAYASLTGSALTREMAAQVLDQLYPGQKSQPQQDGIPEIKKMVCEAFSVTETELDSQSRSAKVLWPRQVAMYLAREVAGEPLPEIGRAFGGRNHSTVLNSCRRVVDRVSTDPKAAMTVRSLERRINSSTDRLD
jgi:chromosomal replication initiator protein